MRYIAILITVTWPLICGAQDWEDRSVFGAPDASVSLRVLSSTDTSFFAPIIESFISENGDVAVEYLVTGTADLDSRFRADPDAYDVVISSAMDLQLKLANDGFAARLDGIALPNWAKWRDSLFAFTTEPATIVINTAAFERLAVPKTRQDLIAVLRANPDMFRGKVGTYDVRSTETFWRLIEVMGGLDAQLYCCSGDMIDDLSSGRILVAYNVLGSYARARAEQAESITVILPSDFPTTMMRSALVSRGANSPTIAESFVRHLILLQSMDTPSAFPLPPLQGGPDAAQSSIGLEPALMTYLDRLKRQTFLREWESAIIQTQ